ncbi:hypothetical protein AXY43_23010 [Clostridium sp. MF28]|uniref:DUF3102 domain-containing protein n=1 Tax=Clostridium TaxID=1485 RepID=UPI000CFA67E7|nr:MULTISPECIES: DUF3102 domain-containing protein [Clostridium]AVK50653.1 hypothetical protein AXY43_23010 [Clostridium sp. MF28]PSM59018.1 hypothetical protein C4L39_03935 [Clostridium diolis]
MTKVLTKKEYNQLSEDEKTMASLISDIVTAKEDIAKNILEIGNKLYVAKQLVPHGEWESWLAEKVDFSVRSAQTYIKTYKIMMDLPEELDSTLGKLGSSKLVEIATIKKDDIEGFITSTHSVDGTEKTVDEMSVRELKEVIKENKKSKKKSKQNKNADVCVNETEKVVDVDFKESQQEESTLTEEQKLSKIIKEQQELEQQLKIKQRQAKETKESILKNKKSLDLKVEFEEVLKDGIFYSKELHYNVYLIRGCSKEIVLEDLYADWIIGFEVDGERDIISSNLRVNRNLLQEEKDFIIGECLRFKEKAIKRNEEIKNMSTWEEEMYKKINEKISKKQQEPQEVQDLKKEFIIAGYKALAKKYHPDCNQGDAEAEDKFKAVGVLKDMFLQQQNLLN